MHKPRHIAVVMDGNGRWAVKRLLPRVVGHSKGIEAAKNLVKLCVAENIEILSLFAFSTENWNRPQLEVKVFMELLLKLLTEEITEIHEKQVKLTVIGAITKLSIKLQTAIERAMALTKDNTGLKLNIAINYGGKWDIVQAMQQIATKILNAELKIADLTEQVFADHLSLGELPDPDLLIRTSGEQRISNFFLWQHAYTELFFTNTLWPDFGENDFEMALKFYSTRVRKFGEVKESTHA